MSRRRIGLALVVVQRALLAAVLLLPWTDPLSQRDAVIYVCVGVLALGVALAGATRCHQVASGPVAGDRGSAHDQGALGGTDARRTVRRLRAPRRPLYPRHRGYRLNDGVTRAAHVEPRGETKSPRNRNGA